MRTPSAAIAYARRFTTYRTQYCLNAVQTWLGSPNAGPWAMWAYQNAKRKHPGDKNPPPGAPVYWSTTRHKYGHVALSVGGGRVRSTDYPTRGRVSETSINEITRWGAYRYEGWTEDIGGQSIPGLGTPVAARPVSGFKTGQVYQHVCHEGVRNMDSVRNVQIRLIQLGFAIPAGPTGNWPVNGQTTRALRAWQQKNGQGGEWATGKKLGFRQAQKLFAGTGMVIKP